MFAMCPVSTGLAKVPTVLNSSPPFQHYGTRPVAMVGTVLFTASTALAAAVDSFYWFLACFAVLGGVGSGMVLVQVDGDSIIQSTPG